jgi:hypothetical protein
MSPGTAREALIAEAIGDVAHLLDRVDALTQGMEGARRALAAAAIDLSRQLASVDARLTVVTEKMKTHAVEHIVRRTNEVAAQSLDDQKRAMADAARTLFDQEIGTRLTGLCGSLQRLIQRADRPWVRWGTHAATALVTAAASWGLAFYLSR